MDELGTHTEGLYGACSENEPSAREGEKNEHGEPSHPELTIHALPDSDVTNLDTTNVEDKECSNIHYVIAHEKALFHSNDEEKERSKKHMRVTQQTRQQEYTR